MQRDATRAVGKLLAPPFTEIPSTGGRVGRTPLFLCAVIEDPALAVFEQGRPVTVGRAVGYPSFALCGWGSIVVCGLGDGVRGFEAEEFREGSLHGEGSFERCCCGCPV